MPHAQASNNRVTARMVKCFGCGALLAVGTNDASPLPVPCVFTCDACGAEVTYPEPDPHEEPTKVP